MPDDAWDRFWADPPADLEAMLDKIEHTRLTLGVEAAQAMWATLGLPMPGDLPPVPEDVSVPGETEMEAIIARGLGPEPDAPPTTVFGH